MKLQQVDIIQLQRVTRVTKLAKSIENQAIWKVTIELQKLQKFLQRFQVVSIPQGGMYIFIPLQKDKNSYQSGEVWLTLLQKPCQWKFNDNNNLCNLRSIDFQWSYKSYKNSKIAIITMTYRKLQRVTKVTNFFLMISIIYFFLTKNNNLGGRG